MSEQSCRDVLHVRSGGVCEVCGLRRAESVHHRNKQGREWTPGNTLHLCGHGTVGCHSWIERHPLLSIALGLWVPRHGDPLAVPAYIKPSLFLRGWWWLHDDGTFTWLDDHAPVDDLDRATAVQRLTEDRLTRR